MSRTGLPLRIKIVRRSIEKRLLISLVRAAMSPAVEERIRNKGWTINVVPSTAAFRGFRTALGQKSSLLAGVTFTRLRLIRVHAPRYPNSSNRYASDRDPSSAANGYLMDRGKFTSVESFLASLSHELYHAAFSNYLQREAPTRDQLVREEHACDVYSLSRVAAFNDEPFEAVTRR